MKVIVIRVPGHGSIEDNNKAGEINKVICKYWPYSAERQIKFDLFKSKQKSFHFSISGQSKMWYTDSIGI